MKNENIRISEKHGLNPSMIKCPVCGNDDGIALLGKINSNDDEAPRFMLNTSPCEKCNQDFETYKTKGFIFFVIDDEFDRDRNKNKTPWQYFNSLHVVKHEAIKDFNIDKSKGAAFLTLSLAKQIGLIK